MFRAPKVPAVQPPCFAHLVDRRTLSRKCIESSRQQCPQGCVLRLFIAQWGNLGGGAAGCDFFCKIWIPYSWAQRLWMGVATSPPQCSLAMVQLHTNGSHSAPPGECPLRWPGRQTIRLGLRGDPSSFYSAPLFHSECCQGGLLFLTAPPSCTCCSLPSLSGTFCPQIMQNCDICVY